MDSRFSRLIAAASALPPSDARRDAVNAVPSAVWTDPTGYRANLEPVLESLAAGEPGPVTDAAAAALKALDAE